PLARDDADAEALAEGPDGSLWIAFEQRHRIERVEERPEGWRRVAGSSVVLPASFGARGNQGVEAMVSHGDGQLWMAGEYSPWPGRSDAGTVLAGRIDALEARPY